MPANVLQNSQIYALTVTGTYSGTTLSNSVTVRVSIIAADLVAIISGASERSVSVGKQVYYYFYYYNS